MYRRGSIYAYKADSCGIDPRWVNIFAHFDRFLIDVLSLKISQIINKSIDKIGYCGYEHL